MVIIYNASISWTIIRNTIMFQKILVKKSDMEPVEQPKKIITYQTFCSYDRKLL